MKMRLTKKQKQAMIDRFVQAFIERDVEDVATLYIDIVKGVNEDIEVDKELVKQYVRDKHDYSSCGIEYDYDFDLTFYANVRESIDSMQKPKYSYNPDPDDDEYVNTMFDSNTPEELYKMGLELKFIKELKKD